MGAGECRPGWDSLSQGLPGVHYAFFSPEMPLLGSTQLLPRDLKNCFSPFACGPPSSLLVICPVTLGPKERAVRGSGRVLNA